MNNKELKEKIDNWINKAMKDSNLSKILSESLEKADNLMKNDRHIFLDLLSDEREGEDKKEKLGRLITLLSCLLREENLCLGRQTNNLWIESTIKEIEELEII